VNESIEKISLYRENFLSKERNREKYLFKGENFSLREKSRENLSLKREIFSLQREIFSLAKNTLLVLRYERTYRFGCLR
jgi:hypothetical protein